MAISWRKSRDNRGEGQGVRHHLVRALGKRRREKRLAAIEALLSQPLAAAEVTALCSALTDLTFGEPSPDGHTAEEGDRDSDLALRIVIAFGQARWRRALPTLVRVLRETDGACPLHEAARQAVEAIQPGLSDPACQVPDAPGELVPRTIMEKGLLVRGGMQALKDFLTRMPLCGAFATVEMPRTRTEEAFRADRQRFADRRLRGHPDLSGTLDEVTQRVIDGLYAVAADLGHKREVSERSLIQPHTREGIPGLAEVRSQFGLEFGYVDLVARCDRDWFYYWGTEL